MKKLVVVFALVSFVACKNKEVTPETNDSKEVETKEIVTENTINYESYGMQSDDVPKGLAKGTKAPNVDFVIDGKQVALADLYKDQSVAIIFYRGFWCPVCSKHLAEFATRAKELEAKGIKLIAVTPESEEGVEKTKDKSKATFAIVSDTGGSIQEAFDVDYKVTDAYAEKVKEALKISIPENNGSETAQLPVPATYVIDKTGTIIYAHFDPDYKKRASIDDILAAL